MNIVWEVMTGWQLNRTRADLADTLIKTHPVSFPEANKNIVRASLLLQSYMEDHMKNKDRLEKEWEALCAYQAEPNASTVGTKDGNAKKNRSPAVVACKSLTLFSASPLANLSRKFVVDRAEITLFMDEMKWDSSSC